MSECFLDRTNYSAQLPPFRETQLSEHHEKKHTDITSAESTELYRHPTLNIASIAFFFQRRNVHRSHETKQEHY